jgi:hypothetical protein
MSGPDNLGKKYLRHHTVDWAGFKTGKNGIFTLIVTLARIAQFSLRTTPELKYAVAEVYYSLIMAASLPWPVPTMSEAGKKRNNDGSLVTLVQPSTCLLFTLMTLADVLNYRRSRRV